MGLVALRWPRAHCCREIGVHLPRAAEQKGGWVEGLQSAEGSRDCHVTVLFPSLLIMFMAGHISGSEGILHQCS